MATIHLEKIAKRYGAVDAVQPLDLQIRDGEFFTLLGPSGCGKTTLLRMIAGLESVSAGRIILRGRDVTDFPPKDRDVALVFQDYALYPHMSVRENLAFPLRARRLAAAEIDRKITEVSDRLRIEALLDRRPRQLSGGQQQRVALGRAMVRNPQAFLMDEPLSNLDAKLRVLMRGELKRLQKDLGITTLYVTHDQEEAMTMSDRIAVMRDGTIQQCAEPQMIYRLPVNRWVAEFVGSPAMNVIDAIARRTSEGTVVVAKAAPSFRLCLSGVKCEGPLWLGIRPEHMAIHLEDRADTLPGRVHVVEPVGDHNIVQVRTDCGVLNVKLPGEDPPDMERQVYLAANPERVHLFSSETGQRIGI